jgi:trimeric autotransporter adhesin
MSQFFINQNASGGDVISITGNSGTPATGAVTLQTANTTVKFVSGGSTVTQDFGLTNLALGSSMPLLTSGVSNVGYGFGANASITVAIGCVSIGYGALSSNSTGSENTCTGTDSLGACTAGLNCAYGFQSLYGITIGSQNVAIGSFSGNAYTSSESSNILISNVGVISESHVIRIGTQGISGGQQNTCYIAGITGVTTSNSQYVTINTSTGQLGSSANVNIVSGNLILTNTNSAGTSGEIIFGSNRFISNYGTENTFLGQSSGNTTLTTASATQNTGAGYNTFSALTTGSLNCAFGGQSQLDMQSGSNNCSFGQNSLEHSVSDSNNSCFGFNAGRLIAGGGNNSYFGYESGNQTTTGASNCCFGYQSGSSYTSSESSNICIGAGVTGTVSESNITRIGTGQSACYVSGISGVTTTNSQYVTINTSTGQLGSSASLIPSSQAVYYEDFLTSQPDVDDSPGRVSGTGAAIGGGNIDSVHPGQWEFQTGSTNSGKVSCLAQNGGASSYEYGTNQIIYETALYIQTLAVGGGDDYILYSGLQDAWIFASGVTNGVFFQYEVDTSLNWIIGTSNAGTQTLTTTTIPVATGWTTLKIIATPATPTASFYVNGVLAGTITTNHPIGNLVPWGMSVFKTNGTTNLLFYLDYYYVQINNATAR